MCILLDQNLGKNNKFLQGICINPYLLREELMNNNKQLLRRSGHSGPWKKFYGGPKDLRAHKLTWTAKEPPPVYTSLDHLNEHWGRDRRGGILRQQAQQLILDEYNNRLDEARARFEHERGAQENARNAARQARDAQRRAG